MIAKFKNRVDFSGIVDYAHDFKSDEKRARVIGYRDVCIVSNETIADSFNTNLKRKDSKGKVHHRDKPVRHISISFSPSDAHLFPDNEEGDRRMNALVEEWLHGMGYNNIQYLCARHFDKQHPHCHLVYSVIDSDGNPINNYNEILRSNRVCREIKLRHGLTFGNPKKPKVNREQLREIDGNRFDLKMAVLRAVEKSSTWAEFQKALAEDGIEACLSYNKTTGSIRGISFAKGITKHSGSKLCKSQLTYGKLAQKFGPLPEGVYVLETPLEGRPTRYGSVGVLLDSTPSKAHDSQSVEEVRKTRTPYQELESVKEAVNKTFTPYREAKSPNEGEGESATPSDNKKVDSEGASLIPLSTVIDLLMGPAVAQTSGGGGTSNDLDWNDDRRRHKEAEENHNVKPFKRRR